MTTTSTVEFVKIAGAQDGEMEDFSKLRMDNVKLIQHFHSGE